MRTLILIFILVVASMAYSQKKTIDKSNEQKGITGPQAQLRSFYEMRKKMLEEMNKAIPGHSFGDNLTDPFNDPFFDQFFNEEDFIKGFNDNFQSHMQIENGIYQSSWEETDSERILVLKPKEKNTPLEINIKDGMIQITAKSDKKGQSLSYTSSESLPSDVDEKKLKIEQRGDDILVRLPKVVGKGSNKSKINGGASDEDKLKPLKASPGDVTI